MKLSNAQLTQPAPTERSQPGMKVSLARSLETARRRWALTEYQCAAPWMANGSYFAPLTPSGMKNGAIICVGQPALA